MTENANTPPSAAKKISGVYIIIALVLIMVAVNYRSAITTVYCDSTALETKPDVVMLGTSWCPYCAQARKYFHKNNVNYCEYDIERSAEGERLYNSLNGGPIPILIIDDKHYIGFDARAFENLMKTRQAL